MAEIKTTFTRPTLSPEDCVALVLEHWAVKAAQTSSLPSYDDQNYRVRDAEGTLFVFKAYHAEESEQVLRLQDAVMARLAEAGVAAPVPVKTVRDGLTFVRVGLHWARLLRWVPGQDWAALESAEAKAQLMGEMGALVARVDNALAGLDEPAARRQWVWRTSDVHLLRQYQSAAVKRQSSSRVALLEELLTRYEKEWRAEAEQCAEGVVHNDVNDHNTLVEEGHVTGVIDLGDVCVERYCFALGNTLYYALLLQPLTSDHLIACARDLVHGYEQHRKLSALERKLVWVGAQLRCLVSATMSGYASEQHPEDAYVAETEKPGWELLEAMQKCNPF